MINWTEKELKKLQEYYEERMADAEKQIETSSYPPFEQSVIDESQAIIWLIRDMVNEKSWIYKLCNL